MVVGAEAQEGNLTAREIVPWGWGLKILSIFRDLENEAPLFLRKIRFRTV